MKITKEITTLTLILLLVLLLTNQGANILEISKEGVLATVVYKYEQDNEYFIVYQYDENMFEEKVSKDSFEVTELETMYLMNKVMYVKINKELSYELESKDTYAKINRVPIIY